MKKILFAIIITIFYCQSIFAKDRVAIVGNSLASNFCYYNNIEGENIFNNAWIGRHCIGGDELESYGLPRDLETYQYGVIPKTFGKGFIKNMLVEANQYDYIICFFGSNYVDKVETQIENTKKKDEKAKEFYTKYVEFVKGMRANNPEAKIILMEIPNGKIGSKYDISEERLNEWNRQIRKIANEYRKGEVVYEKMEDMVFNGKDVLHFDKESNQKLWKRLVEKYNIDLEPIFEPKAQEEKKKKK